MASASLRARLTLNDSLFHAGLRRSIAGARRAGSAIGGGLRRSVGGSIAAVGGLLAGVMTVRAFAGGLKGALDLGGAMMDLSANTGAASGELLILGQAMADNGVAADEAGGMINKMQKSLFDASRGSKQAALGFTQIGLRVKDLLKMKPTEQMRAIGEAIDNIKDPTDRAGAAMEIFGKSGAKLLAMFGDRGAIETAAKTLGRQTKLLSENAEAFATISDRLDRSGKKLQGFFVGAASILAPALLVLTAAMDKADFAEQGERFGRGMMVAAEVFTGAFKNPELMLGALQAGLSGVMRETGNVLVAVMSSAVSTVFSKDFAQGFASLFFGLAEIFGGALIGQMEKANAFLQAGMDAAIGAPKHSEEKTNARAASVRFRDQQIDSAFAALKAKGKGDMESAKKHEAISKRAMALADEQDKIAFGKLTIQERVNKIMASGQSGKEAARLAASGKGGVANGLKLIGQMAASKFEVKDVFGAGAAKATMLNKAGAVRASGAKAVADFIGPMQPPGKMDRFKDFTTMGFGAGGLGSTGGLDNKKGLNGGAWGAVRRGDQARRDAELKKKEPAEETNNLLTKAIGIMQRTLE